MEKNKNERINISVSTPDKNKKNRSRILKQIGIPSSETINVKKDSNLFISEDHIMLDLGGTEFSLCCPRCLSPELKLSDLICHIDDENDLKDFILSGLFCIDCGYFQSEALNGWSFLNSQSKKRKTLKLSKRIDEYLTSVGNWFAGFSLSKNFVIVIALMLTFLLLLLNHNIREFTADVLGSKITILNHK